MSKLNTSSKIWIGLGILLLLIVLMFLTAPDKKAFQIKDLGQMLTRRFFVLTRLIAPDKIQPTGELA